MASEEYKKVIVVNGSPRKGNTEWMLGEFVEVLTDNLKYYIYENSIYNYEPGA